MAGVKISELLLLTDPDLADEIIVNDVDILTTKRATLQSIRDLANQNIDDTPTGSEVTGDLNVTGDISGENIEARNSLTVGGETITDFSDLSQYINAINSQCAETFNSKISLTSLNAGEQNLYVVMRDTAFGCDSSFTNTGLQYNLYNGGVLKANYFEGDGRYLDNVDSARHSQVSDLATLALAALVADSANHSLWSDWSREQQVASAQVESPVENTPDYFVLFSPLQNGIDSVNTNAAFTYNPGSGTLTSAAFVGDGSGLTNVNATSFTADTLLPTQAEVSENFNLLMFPNNSIDVNGNATDYDSANVDGDGLLYNPQTNSLFSGLNYDPLGNYTSTLYLYGTASIAEKTLAKELIQGTGTHYAMFRKRGWQTAEFRPDSDEISLTPDVTFTPDGVYGGTLSSNMFSGSGYLLTDVRADSAIAARSMLAGSVSASPAQPEVYYLSLTAGTGGFQGHFGDASGLIYNNPDKTLQSPGGFAHKFILTANGTNHYSFTDPENVWFPSAEDDPTLYLRRGETYYFDNQTTASPLRIQSSSGLGGTAYNTGVTNNGAAAPSVLTFRVPMSAPATLFYQSTADANMSGTINIV